MDPAAQNRRVRPQVDDPCGLRWSELSGDGSRRSCATCEEQVTDLSAMAERAASTFLATHPGSCVRFVTGRDGAPRFRPARRGMAGAVRAWVLAVIAALMLLTVGFIWATEETEVMGFVYEVF